MKSTAKKTVLKGRQPLASHSKATTQLVCFGEQQVLTISSQMPYMLASVGGHKGYFMVDFGTTGSTIDPASFPATDRPAPVTNTTNQFDGFDFFGGWGRVTLQVQDHSNINGTVKQAGIIGTDFLALNVFTLDYKQGHIYRTTAQGRCSKEVLLAQGFRPASTEGYYSNDLSKLKAGVPNIPTVPVRAGTVSAVAQLDTGFDDSVHRHSVNINRAFFDAIQASGIALQQLPGPPTILGTCTGGTETVVGYRPPSGYSFAIIGSDGKPVVSADDVVFFLKDPPAAAKPCGGIGTWGIPAAQLGASFFIDANQVIFDPFSATVWFGK